VRIPGEVKRDYPALMQRADAIFIDELRMAVDDDGTSGSMTADRAPLPHDPPGRVSSRLINEVQGINRVTHDISSKRSAKIEWAERLRGLTHAR